jgi:hypothetical protein
MQVKLPVATVVLAVAFGAAAGLLFAAPALAAGAGYAPPAVITTPGPPLAPPAATGGPVLPPSLPVTAPALTYTPPHRPHHRASKEPSRLTSDSPSGTPGASVSMNGEGCTPQAPVVFTVDRRRVGQATADQAGDFTAAIVVPNVAVGQYTVRASCGPTLGTVLNVTLLTDANPGSLAFVILIFFVLAGLFLLQLILRPGRHE